MTHTEQEQNGHDAVPESIDAFVKQFELNQKELDTLWLWHWEAWAKAERRVTDDGGHVDHKKLNESKIREGYAKEMAMYYLDQIAERMGKNKGDFSLEKDLSLATRLMYSFVGFDNSTLLRAIEEHQDDYDFRRHFATVNEPMERMVTPLLNRAAEGHLRAHDRADIVHYMKAEGVINPDRIPLEEAIEHLRRYQREGISPTEKMLRGKDYLLSADNARARGQPRVQA